MLLISKTNAKICEYLQARWTMKELIKRLQLDRWISEGAPAFWVLGISMLLCAGALRILSVLFVFLQWRIPALVAYWGVGLLVVGFVGCGIWFVFDARTASRPTPWRK
jgi:hypothetical protein